MKNNQITSGKKPVFKRVTCACENKYTTAAGQRFNIRKGKSIYPLERRKMNSFQTVKSRFLKNQKTL